MKTLFLFTLTIVLALNLNARENPFEVTNAYEEEVASIIEQNEALLQEEMQNEQYIQEMQAQMSKKEDENKNKVEEAVNKIIPVIKEKPAEKIYTKKEVDSLINKTKKQTEQKTKEIVKKELENTKVMEPTQVVYVKPRPDLVDDDAVIEKKILPFVRIEFNDKKLLIHTKYKVSKKFSVNKENKLIIDYKAKVNFYTKRENLESKTFPKIAVGNHKNEGFFRVVLELEDKPSKYDVTYKDNLITVSKKD